MRITDIQLHRSGDTQELSGKLDHFRLWMRFPADSPVLVRGDAFLIMALVPAMAIGEPLEIETSAPVSPKLLAAMDRLQGMFHCWEPMLRKIPVIARPAAPDAAFDGVGTFFSGGLDSSYTVAKRFQELSHLIFIRGYDLAYDDDVYATAKESYSELARRLGKELIYVETNRQQLNRELLGPLVGRKNGFTARHIIACRSQASGSIMPGVGLALGLRKCYMSTGVTYDDMSPYGGLSPIVDPLWSTEGITFVHEGAEASRSRKLKAISEMPDLMNFLRICRKGGAYNCGKCAKCVRTMIPMRLLGLSAPSLPALASWNVIRKFAIHPEELLYYEDNLRLARQAGEPKLAAILRNKILAFHIRQHLKLTDRLLFGGAGLRTLHHLKGLDRVQLPPAAAEVRQQA